MGVNWPYLLDFNEPTQVRQARGMWTILQPYSSDSRALTVWNNEADASLISTELWFLGAFWGVTSLISTFKLSILTYCQPFINNHINNNNMMGQTKVESESSSSWSCHMFCKVDWVIFTPTDSSLSKNTFSSSSVTDRQGLEARTLYIPQNVWLKQITLMDA